MHTTYGSRPAFAVSIAAIMVFQAAALFARGMLERSLIQDGVAAALAEDASYLVVPPILLILMYPYLSRCRHSLRTLLQPGQLTMRLVLRSIALGLILRVMRWSGITLLIPFGVAAYDDPHAPGGPLLGFDCPPAGILLLSFAVMGVLVPVIEEVMNRGFILHALLPRGKILAIGFSALLFSATHGPSSYAIAFIGGVVFAAQALSYRSLWAPILAHAAYNAAAVVDWECFSIVWNPLPADPALDRIVPLALAVTATGAILVCYLVSAKAAGANGPCQRPTASR